MSLVRARELLQLWPVNGRPESTDMLRARYAVYSNRVSDDVMSELHILQEHRLVRIDDRGWHLTPEGRKIRAQLPPPPEVNSPMPGTVSHQVQPLAKASSRLGPRTAIESHPPTPPAVVELVSLEAPDPSSLQTLDESSPWAMFRRALGYYTSCIKLEERPNISLYGDKLNHMFIPLTFRGRWYPEDHEVSNAKLRVPTMQVQSQFWRLAFNLDESQSLQLGYPLHIINRPDYCLIRPVGCIPVSITDDADSGVDLQVHFEDMDINAGWVEQNVKQEASRSFLARSGVAAFGEDDESTQMSPTVGKLKHALELFAGDFLLNTLDPNNVPLLEHPERLESGVHDYAIVFIEKRNKYNASLLREMRQIAQASDKSLDQSALRHIYLTKEEQERVSVRLQRSPTNRSTENAPVSTELSVPFLQMNDEQERAVRAAQTRPLTVITGPPGTGKSQVAANLIANLSWQQQSAIFCSRNHKAIDAVVPRTNALVGEGRDLIVRQSDGQASGTRFSWQTAIRSALSLPPAQVSPEQAEALLREMSKLLDVRSKLVLQADRWADLKDKMGELQQRWDEFEEASPAGLVTTTRTTDSDSFRQLAKRCLATKLPDYTVSPNTFIDRLRCLLWKWRRQKSWESAVVGIREDLENLALEPRLSDDRLTFNDDLERLSEMLEKLAELSEVIVRLGTLEMEAKSRRKLVAIEGELSGILQTIKEIGPQILDACLDLRIHSFEQQERAELLTLRNAFANLNAQALSPAQRRRLMAKVEANIDVLLHMYPMWATTAQSARHILPLLPGCVDLAIIDEASQCDVASMIPILYRARRVAVIGDPMQLRPVIQIKAHRNQLLLAEHGLITPEGLRFDFHQGSLFELADSAPADVERIMLQCHFRCERSIAAYFNQAFYRKALFVLTDAGKLKLAADKGTGIVWTEVEGQAEHGGGPTAAAICREEIVAVVAILERLRDQQFDGTVGVITPFRTQARRINDAVENAIPRRVQDAWNFECDTVHSFQGGERDLIIMSLCYQPGLAKGATWLIEDAQNRNLWNVAISRARAVIHLIGNRDMCRESSAAHLRILADPPEPTVPELRYRGFQSPWERILHDALREQEIVTVTQYPLVGRYLDLAIPDSKIDLEVDGEQWHRDTDGRRKADDLWRDIQVQSAGWKVIRFWVYELREDLPACVALIRSAIEETKRAKEAGK